MGVKTGVFFRFGVKFGVNKSDIFRTMTGEVFSVISRYINGQRSPANMKTSELTTLRSEALQHDFWRNALYLRSTLGTLRYALEIVENAVHVSR